jgi:DNA-binding HxlR family transcriptional regulator
MRGYGQFCPVAKACEVVAERWTPLVLRELFCGSRRFNDLHRGVPLMSRSLLTRRLRELEDAGVVARRPGGQGSWEYVLTPAGEELRPVVEQLGEWGQRWARRHTAPEDLDAGLLMWDVRRRLRKERLPERRMVVRFDLRNVPRGQAAKRTWWLVADRGDVDLCLKDPGFSIDLTVAADLAALTRVWTGRLAFADASRAGLLRLEGPRDLVRGFPGWLALSSFASVPVPSEPSAGRG